MLKEKNYLFSRLNQLVDMLVIAAAFFIALWTRNHIIAPNFLPELPVISFGNHHMLLWIMMATILVSQMALGVYNSQRLRKARDVFPAIFASCVAGVLVSVGLAVAVPGLDDLSRPQMFWFGIWAALLLMGKMVLVKRLFAQMRAQGLNVRHLLLVGSGRDLDRFIDLLDSHPIWGFDILGIITDDERVEVGSRVKEHEVLGRLKETKDIVKRHANVDEVIFVPSRVPLSALRGVLNRIEMMGVRAHLSLNFFEGSIYSPHLETFEDVPVVTYSPVREAEFALFLKYTFDRIASAVFLLLLSPILLLITLALKIAEPTAPIFYGQTRAGLHGRPFKLWKFRTMVVDADKRLEELKAKNEMTGPVFKMKDDPRITRIGRFLRKTSLDELPQLWNVLVGEMSLVGPRPPIPAEVEEYDDWQRRRLSMKPGITCIWQVSGRNLIDFEDWMKMDLKYIDNWSLVLDFKILLRTVYVVFTGYGSM